MDETSIRRLLDAVASGETPVDQAVAALRTLPFEDMGFAKLDHHRTLRWGFPEVVFCPGKTDSQVASIVERLAQHSPRLLGTRATPEQFQAAQAHVPDLRYHEAARALWLERDPDRPLKPGVMIVAAGTSDLPVAEEAALTLRLDGPRAAGWWLMSAWPACTACCRTCPRCRPPTW